jgi:integrase
VENIGFDTTKLKAFEDQSLECESTSFTDIKRPIMRKGSKFDYMNQTKVTDYSVPILRKGKAIVSVPKGSTKIKEEALQDWYIEYYFTDYSLDIVNKRIKLRADINRVKDPQEKLRRANELLQSVTELLEEGYNPLNEEANTKLRNEIISISVREAIVLYSKHLEDNGTRKKSIQTYMSKLAYFNNVYADAKVNAITSLQIDHFLKSLKHDHSWTSTTFNAARQVLYGFMKYLVKQKYMALNPVEEIDRQKKVEGVSAHKPISNVDLQAIITYLNKHDPFTALFVKALYYTCIRPKELRGLTLGMIDFDNNRITIPGTLSKNKRTDSVVIDVSLRSELEVLNIEQHNKSLYLFASAGTIIGEYPVGENTPYHRFMKCLDVLGFNNKGYSLYCIKHTSNIKRYLEGDWSIAELMVANRHSNISQTETYLRDLNLRIDLNLKAVPPI